MRRATARLRTPRPVAAWTPWSTSGGTGSGVKLVSRDRHRDRFEANERDLQRESSLDTAHAAFRCRGSPRRVASWPPREKIMAGEEVTENKFHVLLIGVDNYPGHLLRGCVNDVDAVRQVLLESDPEITPGSMRILVSPLIAAQRTPVEGELPAR